jgi:hypothetical protein
MTRWLFNSDGDAIGFVSGSSVYTPHGDFIGQLYPDQTIWNGEYLGQVWADDRVIFDTRKLYGTRGLPAMPTLPGFTGEPPYRGPVTVPLGFRDVSFR